MAFTACSDETDAPATPGEGILTVTVGVPQSRSGNEAAPTAAEATINDLRLIAFPQGEGNLINVPLNAPSVGVTTVSERVDGVAKGSYRVWIVANMSDAVSAVTNEDQLRSIILDYTTSLPQPGNLPMVYEPSSTVEIGSAGADLGTLGLTIAAVKVELYLVFDKSITDEFGTAGFKISGITAYNVANTQTLAAPVSFPSSEGDEVARHTVEHGANGTYYKSFTRNTTSDVPASLSDEGTPVASDGKWCYHTVVYLPEHYVSDNSRQTYLDIEGAVIGSPDSVNAKNHYSLPLGHVVGQCRQMPRDTWYEIVANFTTLGSIELGCIMNTQVWSEKLLDGLISRTTLYVDQTKIESVSTIGSAVLSYTSSTSNVGFECVTRTSTGLPYITAVQDKTAGTFTLKANPGISAASLSASERTGTALVRLTANNIVKYVEVGYDLQPMFDLDYDDITIYYEGAQVSRVITVTTNLEGFRSNDTGLTALYNNGSAFGSTSITSGSAKIRLTTAAGDVDGEYKLLVWLDSDPGASTTFTFNVGPYNTSYYTSSIVTPQSTPRKVRVTVKPAKTTYRIYMRAINDRVGGTYPGDGSFLSVLTEEDTPGSTTSANWKDGWARYDCIDNDNEVRHKAYVYYQYGETYGSIPEENVWRFTGEFPGSRMYPDTQNPGWYLITFANGAVGTNSAAPSKGTHPIKPGETLIIFSSDWDPGLGYTRHRFTHHMDPGIPLFNYEDREGWYLYDPLCDPYYRVYDEKPVIANYTYTIWTKQALTGWYHTYGVSGYNDSGYLTQYTIYSNSVSSTLVNGWYKTQLTFKAPVGEYEKAINIKLSGQSVEPMLFGGNSWLEGYYDGSAWHQGAP